MKNLILFALIFSLNLISQEFEIDLSGSMEETVLGAPLYIRVEVRNVSGKGQKIAGTFNYRYILKGMKGGEAQLWNGMEVSYIPCEKVKINYISADWKEVKVEDISQFYIRRKGEIAKDKIKQPGEYRIEVIASPRCNKGVDKEGLLDYNVWHGQLKKEIVIEIKEPEGVDREAYEYFKGNVPLSGERAKELLEKFPTSTYAGWAIKNIQTANWAFRKEKHIEEYKWKRKLIENFIEAHPEFLFAGELAADAGYISLILGEMERACYFFQKSLKLGWDIPQASDQYINDQKEKVNAKIKELKDKGKCK